MTNGRQIPNPIETSNPTTIRLLIAAILACALLDAVVIHRAGGLVHILGLTN